MKLPCLCTVEDQYLPLDGYGERAVNCEHGEWVIEGRRQTTVVFYIVKSPLEEKESKDGAGAE